MSVSSRQNPCPILRAILRPVRDPRASAPGRPGGRRGGRRRRSITSRRSARSSRRTASPVTARTRSSGPRGCGSTAGSPRRRSCEDGAQAIVPGDPDASELVARITEEDDSLRMPPQEGGRTRSRPEEVDAAQALDRARGRLRRALGLRPARGTSAPRGRGTAALAEERDRLLDPRPPGAGRARAVARGRPLHAAPPRQPRPARPAADAARRSTAFADDPSPDAYEKAVDRFLADPAYGERWARMWLDLARYADSAGYGSDPLRPNIWRVSRLGHRRLQPQPAVRPVHRSSSSPATCCPSPTLEQRIATAFHRNTMTNTEGGTDDEEFRVAAVKDRVDTTMQVWMGLTMGCAKCHTHKYDPITQRGVLPASSPSSTRPPTPTARTSRRSSPRRPPAQREQDRRIDAADRRAEGAARRHHARDRRRPGSAGRPSWASVRNGSTLEPVSTRSGVGCDASRACRTARSGSAARTPTATTYTIAARTSLEGITAFRLEALPDRRSPAGARAGRRTATSSSRESRVEVDPGRTRPPRRPRRYVRVELPGEGKILSLAEVAGLRGGENVARGGEADAVEHRLSTARPRGRSTATPTATTSRRTRPRTPGPRPTPGGRWTWRRPRPIDRIVLWNRTDEGVDGRLAGARVQRARRRPQGRLAGRGGRSRRARSVELAPDGRKPVAIATAAADFAQDGFAVADVLDPKVDAGKGWAVGPRQKEPHEAVFALEGAARRSRRRGAADDPAGARLPGPGPRPRPLPALGHDATPRRSRRARVPAAVLAILDTPPDAAIGRAGARPGAALSLDRARAPARPRRDRPAGEEPGRRSRRSR